MAQHTAWMIALSILAMTSCKEEAGQEPAHARQSSPSTRVPTTPNLTQHNPSTPPPIDCPLRKAGIDPHKMKPFDEVDQYIAFLDRPDRVAWQKPDEVVQALGLTGSEVVADVGAGSGYFTFRLAKALPKGHVVALDIEPEMIRHIHHTAMTEGLDNVQTGFAKPDDPSVPKDADWVFVCDVVHHVDNRIAWLKRMYDEMKPEAKVALLEFKSGDLPEGPPEALKLSKNELMALMKEAGFRHVAAMTELLPYQNLLIFEKGVEAR